MWVFKRSILPRFNIVSDGMAFSEELKIEAFTQRDLRCTELPIYYRARVGESKLNVWKDGFYNLFFLFRKRFGLAGASQARPFAALADRSSRAVARIPLGLMIDARATTRSSSDLHLLAGRSARRHHWCFIAVAGTMRRRRPDLG